MITRMPCFMFIMIKLAKEFKKQVRISELTLVHLKELEKRGSYLTFMGESSEQDL